jgi:hypothetical protein
VWETTRRRRIIDTFNWGGNVVTTTYFPPPTPPIISVSRSPQKRDGFQDTVSTDTPYPYYKRLSDAGNPGAKRYLRTDLGSNFQTSRAYCSGGADLSFTKTATNVVQQYKGRVLPWIPLASELNVLPFPNPSEELSILGYGTTAVARCIPTNPVAGLANFLGELRRDGLPKRPGESMRKEFERGQTLKGLSSEYLNYQFAIAPFLNDVRSFATVVKDHDKILKQYLRDSGKDIRRSYSFPVESTITNSVISPSYYPQGGNLPASWFNPGVLTLQTVTTVERWFSGRFCYLLTFGDSQMEQLKLYEQKANKLLGVRLTPELVWNLTPWTWAADWFANAGDVFHNVSAFSRDGLVMRHGYVMERKTITKTYTLSGYSVKSGTTGACPPLTLNITQQRKVRRKASPYGFGVKDVDLSPRQIAILAALGINRSAGAAK